MKPWEQRFEREKKIIDEVFEAASRNLGRRMTALETKLAHDWLDTEGIMRISDILSKYDAAVSAELKLIGDSLADFLRNRNKKTV